MKEIYINSGKAKENLITPCKKIDCNGEGR
jgi:hypothetical protein